MPWYIILPYDTPSRVANRPLKRIKPLCFQGKTGVRSRFVWNAAGFIRVPVQGFSFILQIQGSKHCTTVFAIVLPAGGFSLKAER